MTDVGPPVAMDQAAMIITTAHGTLTVDGLCSVPSSSSPSSSTSFSRKTRLDPSLIHTLWSLPHVQAILTPLRRRYRRRAGMNPYYFGPHNGALGWRPYGQQPPVQPQYAAPPADAVPPVYSPPSNHGFYGNDNTNHGYFGGQQSGVELQPPSSTYQPPHGGDPVYSPPDGPPPKKTAGDGIIR